MKIHTFFDQATATYSYIVADNETKTCAIIDSVLNLDYAAGRTATTSADLIIETIRQYNYRLEWILETHIHADHLTAAPYLKQQLGGKTGIGKNVIQVQETFKDVLDLGESFSTDGNQFDRLFEDGNCLKIGNLDVEILNTPGHTPACISYLIGDAVFVGDTVFMPDVGTARCDFPGGDAKTLYQSIQKILALPPETKIYLCHDYPADGRTETHISSVAEQKQHNIHIMDGVSEEEFISMRTRRDATLNMPVLIFPSLQINIRGSHEIPASDNGTQYLKVPLNAL